MRKARALHQTNKQRQQTELASPHVGKSQLNFKIIHVVIYVFAFKIPRVYLIYSVNQNGKYRIDMAYTIIRSTLRTHWNMPVPPLLPLAPWRTVVGAA